MCFARLNTDDLKFKVSTLTLARVHSLSFFHHRNHAIENNNKYYNIIFYPLNPIPPKPFYHVLLDRYRSQRNRFSPRNTYTRIRTRSLSLTAMGIVGFRFDVPPQSHPSDVRCTYAHERYNTCRIVCSLSLSLYPSLFSVPKITEAYNAPRCMV